MSVEALKAKAKEAPKAPAAPAAAPKAAAGDKPKAKRAPAKPRTDKDGNPIVGCKVPRVEGAKMKIVDQERLATYRGQRAAYAKHLKNGITIGDYHVAVKADTDEGTKANDSAGFLRFFARDAVVEFYDIPEAPKKEVSNKVTGEKK